MPLSCVDRAGNACRVAGRPGGSRMSGPAAAELRLRASLWLGVGERDLGGPERIGLLDAIAEHGSITAAARALGMSYKAAWDAVDLMNRIAGAALVAGSAGGRGGGGARLTERGARLVASYRLLQAEHDRFLATLAQPARRALDDLPLIRSLAMRTSARNQFSGTVGAVRRGAVNDEVELQIGPDLRIVAVITHGSAEALGLAPGASAIALVKASSVVLVAGDDPVRVSARNRLAGTVREVREGGVNADVTMQLPGGATLGAVVTLESARALGLAPGAPVTAIFKASSVIVAVPA